jgi:Icc-related predicted phosphoesterase
MVVMFLYGPPHGILDCIEEGDKVGCADLRTRVKELEHLKLHVFGHIHESYGQEKIGNIQFVNASICNRRYEATNAAIIIDL